MSLYQEQLQDGSTLLRDLALERLAVGSHDDIIYVAFSLLPLLLPNFLHFER